LTVPVDNNNNNNRKRKEKKKSSYRNCISYRYTYLYYPNPAGYKKWGLDAPANPPELQLPRTTLYWLISERTGHGPFVEYHERFGHDASPQCKCGEPRTQGHFIKCRMVKPFLPEQPDRSIRDQETLIQYVLGPEGHKAFQKLLEDASPYSDLPTNLD
jgi:hypothetical protein